MKFRKNKKGFTIVELIIVIAVIGILTAVMVPTIVHLVNKANKASDEALVSNLNKAIQLRRAEPGAKAPTTMHETVEGLKPYGYNVDALVAKSEEDLVYNLKLDKFVLSDDESVRGHEKDFWRVQSRVEADQKYYANSEDEPENPKKFNIYAAEGFSFGDASAICVGFDAGSAEVSSVNYSSHDADEVVIRTNGGDLAVNAPNGVVHHYENLKSVDIQAIHSASYHEHGNVSARVKITKGHFELEETGSVPTIVVEAASASDVSIDLTNATEENAPTVYAESEAVAAELNTIVEASEEVKESSIQDVVFTKHVKNVVELKAALKENGYVILDNNIEDVSAPIWISNEEGAASNIDHAVTLDLDGKSISTTDSFVGRPLMNCVKLTVTGNGTITSVNSGDGYGAIRNFNELVVENGTFLGSPLGGGSAIDNQAHAKLTINDGYFGGTGGLNNRDNGIAVVNGGSFITEACDKLPDEAYCYALRSSGKITVNNAFVRGAHGGVSIEGGTATINYVDSEAFDCSTAEDLLVDHSAHGNRSYYALYIAGEQTNASCVVNGGKFKSNRLYAILIGNSTPGDGGNLQQAFATIKGGEFSTVEGQKIIHIDGTLGYAYLYGGKYSNNNVEIKESKTVKHQVHLSDICDPEMDVYQEGDWYVVR